MSVSIPYLPKHRIYTFSIGSITEKWKFHNKTNKNRWYFWSKPDQATFFKIMSKESPRAHVAKFYGRLRLICSVLRASKFALLKLIEIVILWIYYTIPFGFSFFRHFWDIIFQPFQLLPLAKDHWRGFNTRNAHMVHIVN